MTEEEKTQEKQETAQKPEEGKRIELPPVDFANFIASLANTAFAYLGGLQGPETKEVIVDLGFAKHTIDTIDMLKEKTKGNLTAPESNYLENILYNLKMTYVRFANMPPKQKPQEAEEES